MKTLIKTFACSFAASIALVACNNVGEQNPQDSPGGNNSGIKAACKELSWDPYPDLDPACRSEDKIEVMILDEQEIVFEVDGEYYSNKDSVKICAKGIYINGEYVSMDELERMLRDNTNGPEFKESIRGELEAYYERGKRCGEAMNSKKRDLVVPCKLMYEYDGDRFWTGSAMLTEEEIAELKETYDNISIVHIVPVDDVSIGGNGGDISDPCYVEE